jgi:RNA polymerase sigma factor (sigma-70 family)
MRLPVWKRKTMLAQAIAQENPERAQESAWRDTFVRLIEEYEPALRRLASGYAQQPADREDLFQEIAVGVWQAIPKFRGDSSERTWLYRIAHNVAISFSARVRQRVRKEEPILERSDYPSASADGEQAILRSEKQMLLLRAIQGLPMLDRQIVLLHLEGLNYAQIEEISGLSQSAIGSRLSRLRDGLRERIQAGRRSSDERQG